MKRYRHKISEVIFLLFFSVTFVGIVFIFNNNPTKTIFVNLFFLGMGLLGFYASMKALVVITMTDYSIAIKYPLLPEKKVNLCDIYSLGDSNASQKLILRDFYGNKIVSISKGIVGIIELKEELNKIITQRIKIKPKDCFVKANSFFISIISMCIMVIGTIILSAFMKTISMIPTSILLLSFSYLIYSIGKQIIFVHLSNNSITVKSLFSKRTISIMEIDNIVQKINAKTQKGVITTIVIEMKQGKPISLSGFKPDDELLFQSCKYYFDNSRRAT